jgi:hypothetical protein
MPQLRVLRLETTLLATEGVDSAFIEIDESARDSLGGGGRIPVRATFNGAEYRGTICKMGGAFRLGVNKEVRAAARIEPGDALQVTLARDLAPRIVDVPSDLAAALRRQRPAREEFERLSFTHRKENVRWIESAKKAETRQARVAKAIEMLRAGRRTPDAS